MLSEDYKGFKIVYQESTKDFVATRESDGREIRRQDIGTVRKAIRLLNRKKFERIPCLYKGYWSDTVIKATIISVIEDFHGNIKEVWISFTNEDGKQKRQKEYVEHLFKQTPENLKILEDIDKLEDIQRDLKSRIETLHRNLTNFSKNEINPPEDER